MKYLTGAASTLRSLGSTALGIALYDGTPPTIDEFDSLTKANASDPTLTDVRDLINKYEDNLIVAHYRTSNVSVTDLFSLSNPLIINLNLSKNTGGVTANTVREGTPTWFIITTRLSSQDKCGIVLTGYIPDQMKVEPSLIKQDSVIYISLLAMED